MNKSTPIKIRNQKLAKTVCQNLAKRQFEACCAATREEAVEQLLRFLPKSHTISWGGSDTIQKLGLPELLRKQGYRVIDRGCAKTPEEREELQRRALLCDTFLMSSNAISEDGELVNIDRTGNRIAALLYGPRQVIILAGMNKIVKAPTDAQSRARNTAAPINAQRFEELQTPCALSGSCGNCISKGCLCSHIVTTRMCYPAGRIKVILIGEELGY